MEGSKKRKRDDTQAPEKSKKAKVDHSFTNAEVFRDFLRRNHPLEHGKTEGKFGDRAYLYSLAVGHMINGSYQDPTSNKVSITDPRILAHANSVTIQINGIF